MLNPKTSVNIIKKITKIRLSNFSFGFFELDEFSAISHFIFFLVILEILNYLSSNTESECFGNKILNSSSDTFMSNSLGMIVLGFSKLL